MKKYNSCLLALMVSVFLLLCACAQQQTSQASSEPDALSSIPSSSTPSSTPATSVPATSVPATSIPATSVPATSAPATTPATTPSTAPTQPAVWPDRILSCQTTDWITDREIVPFEERFAADVPFGLYPTIWIAPDTDSAYSDYSVFDLRSCYVIMYNSLETEYIHRIPMDATIPPNCNSLAGDGYWGDWLSDDALYKINLQSGAYTVLDTKSETDIRWDVQACGKDTVCIFRLDAQQNLRIYYRDLHSEAERTVYQGILPDVPTAESGLYFYAPSTTQGQVYWEMINPAFWEAYTQERDNPNSSFKNSASLYMAVQEQYNIPMLVRYLVDFNTGALTEDFGWYDTCWKTKDCRHNHFDYENTKEEVPTVLNVASVVITNFSKLTGDSELDNADTQDPYIYSEFGHGYPYFSLDHPTWKLADFPVIEIAYSWEYVYCITLEGTVVQFNYNGTICNTIYTSQNELRNLHGWGNYVYFIDGNTIICIDEATGTWRPILQSTLSEISLFWYHKESGVLNFTVRQGMYCQNYRYDPLTGELTPQ